MPRQKSHYQTTEPLLESAARYLRYLQVTPHIKSGSSVLDLGSGHKGYFLQKIAKKIESGLDIDISVSNKDIPKNIRLIKKNLETPLNIPKNHFDHVVLLAVIEHVHNPKKVLKESYGALKPGGVLLITTPSKRAKRFLEILSKLDLISKEEIEDHKHYFEPGELKKIIADQGFDKKNVDVRLFELGLNIFAKAVK